MNILVAGATGVLGRRVVAGLVAGGHTVSGVARSDDAARRLTAMGARPHRADLFAIDEVRQAVAGRDAVVNLTTSIPAFRRATRAGAWKMNHRIREEVSANLVAASAAAGVTTLVQESVAFPYRDGGDRWIDEDGGLAASPHTGPVSTAEAAVERFRAAGGTGVVLRFGMLYSVDSEHALAMARMASRCLSPVVGKPHAFLSFVHADDAAGAVVAALTVPSGTYNVVDDAPIRRSEFDALLGDVLGRRKIRRLPPIAVRLGGPYLEVLSRSQRVTNERFRAASSWQPACPTPAAGWRTIVAEWRRDGLLPPAPKAARRVADSWSS